MAETRLVAMTDAQYEALRESANYIEEHGFDDSFQRALCDAYDRGITEEEARLLGDHPATLAPTADEPGTFAYKICQIVPKLRDAFRETDKDG